MAPLRFDRSRIEGFLERAVERLDGEWLLVGGGAAAIWFAPARTSEDIDLIGLAGTNAQRLALMTLASEMGIPIEAVNSAADFFLEKIEDWRNELVVMSRGTGATIYRPSATLFLLLKIRRLSAVDLDDCLALLEHCAGSGEQLDRVRVRAAISALAPTADRALGDRRAELDAALARA